MTTTATKSDLIPNTTYRVSFKIGKNTHYGTAKTDDEGKMAGVKADRLNGTQYPLWINVLHVAN